MIRLAKAQCDELRRGDSDGEGVRRPRPIGAPVVAPGPLRELKALMHLLYLDAGAPSLDEIVSMIAEDDSLPGSPGRDTVRRLLGSPDLPASRPDVVSLVAVLAEGAGADRDGRVAYAAELWAAAHDWKPQGAPTVAADPMDLEVHRAIPVDGIPTVSVDLPPYVRRSHDDELSRRLYAGTGSGGRICVLVGQSATGKTRALFEVVRALPEPWRVWHPIHPTRPDALLDGLQDVAPMTVIWLNEAQDYLDTPGRHDGERAAAGLRALLRDPERGPVWVLGTLWPEHWRTLTQRPLPGDSDTHAQARQLLEGAVVPVPSCFDADVVEVLATASDVDARLREAARGAADGEIAQYLAGAPALRERYLMGSPPARAIVQAAVDARRLGHGRDLRGQLLRSAGPGYMSDRDWANAAGTNWFEVAIAELTRPGLGSLSPLIQVPYRRMDAGSNEQDLFRLADVIEHDGRESRRRTPPAEELWTALEENPATAMDALRIGLAADKRLRWRVALTLLRTAHAGGIENAREHIADLLYTRDDIKGLEAEVDAGNPHAGWRLAETLAVRDDFETIQRRAASGDSDAEAVLARQLAYRRDTAALTELAEQGSVVAARKLAQVLYRLGDVDALATRARSDPVAQWWLQHLPSAAAPAGPTPETRLPPALPEGARLSGIRALADAGDDLATRDLAQLLAGRNEVAELRERSARGDAHATAALVPYRLFDRGDVASLQDMAASGDQVAARLHIDLLRSRDDVDGLRALAGSNWSARHALADRLYARRDLAALEALLSSGDAHVVDCYDRLLGIEGDLVALAARADSGDVIASWRLAEALGNRDDDDALADRANRGDVACGEVLAGRLASRGDVAALNRLADQGHVAAERELGALYAQRGDRQSLMWELERGNVFARRYLMGHSTSDRTSRGTGTANSVE